MSLRLGSLCTGYGGLDLAVEAVLDVTPVWLCEFDPAPAEVCAVRFPGVPNLHDLTTLDWEQVPPVDVLTAGYPCQPFSHAGKRKGTSDVRHLWPHIRDAVRVLRPGLVVLENVAGHVDLGFDTVLADLAALGFDAEWAVVRASDVGACHQRARLFVVAHADDGRCQQRDPGQRRLPVPRTHGPSAADTDVTGPQGAEPAERRVVPAWGALGPAIRRHERALGRSTPDPTDERGRLSPHFVEWMMMLPGGWVTDVLTSRTRALKALGNGVVPPQAAYAISGLLERLQRDLVAA